MGINLNFVSYTGIRPVESHSYAQIVLPLEGGMELEADGVVSKLDVAHAAFLAPGTLHSQQADEENRFLVLNCDWHTFESSEGELLAKRVFLPISPPVRQLLCYADAATREGVSLNLLTNHWAKLLIGSLVPCSSGLPDSRLITLTNLVETSLDQPWTVEGMARRIALSPSRLYALFQEKLKTTPQDWLADLRIKQVQQWLAKTDHSIAELAQRVGYSDQSALTRAMRRITGLTPGAYRKQQQEFWSKDRE